MSLIWICGEDMAQTQNGVALHDTEVDAFGIPIPVITKVEHPNDVLMRRHASAQARRLAEAVGATKVIDSIPTGYGHNMGTNRMSANARDGVVDEFGRCHDIKNLFISDGSQFSSSSAANPTLTIVALAIRQAEFMPERPRPRDLIRPCRQFNERRDHDPGTAALSSAAIRPRRTMSNCYEAMLRRHFRARRLRSRLTIIGRHSGENRWLRVRNSMSVPQRPTLPGWLCCPAALCRERLRSPSSVPEFTQ